MSLFAGLKEKLADKLAEFKASTAPQDPLEKHAFELVDKATSDSLIQTDWPLNFAVVDFVNSDVRLHGGRVLKGIKRSLSKQNTKVRLLSLTLLETCVKNSTGDFHTQLATSELWDDIVKLAGDTSITRVEAEVRDKMLGLVEDFARALQPVQFQASYESLLDRGVDFPVRGADDEVPILTPPAPHAAAAAPGAEPPPAAAAATAAAAAAAAAGDADLDPLAGVDEQDRAAIQAALAELEAEAQAAAEAARVAAAADAEERRQQRLLAEQQHQLRQQQEQQMQPPTQHYPHPSPHPQQGTAEAEAAAAATLVAAAETASAAAAAHAFATAGGEGAVAAAMAADAQQLQQLGAAPHAVAAGGGFGDPHLATGWQQQPHHEQMQQAPAAAEGPELPGERVAELLETANNSTMLLSEMLASVPDSEPLAVREPYVAEVADTCVRLRSRLERELSTLADEALMASALNQHEELTRVLGRYDELLAAAEAVAPTVPYNAAAVALSHAALSQPQDQDQDQGGQAHPGAAPHHGASAEAPGDGVPTSQKVAQTAAGIAAAFREKFTGAFDKLMAAAAPRTAAQPTAAAAGGPAHPGAAPAAAAAVPAGAAAGAFTLLDEDEEPHEGTSLITKRVPGVPAEQQYPYVSYAPPPPVAAAAVPAGHGLHPHQQQLVHLMNEATVVPPLQPPPSQAAAAAMPVSSPAPAVPNLIDLGDEPEPAPPAAPPPQQAGAGASPAPAALPEPFAGPSLHDPPPPPYALGDPSAAASAVTLCVPRPPPLQPVLSVENAATSPQPVASPASAGQTLASVHAQLSQPPPQQQLQGASSRDGSHGDQLVEALDRLVSQASVGNSPAVVGSPRGPEAGEDAAGVGGGVGAGAAHASQ